MDVQKEFQGKGLGELLIKYAVNAANIISETLVGIKFITVDCYEHRTSYYERYGFKENLVQSENRQPDNPKSFRLNIDKYLENNIM